jgi:hypothetical protein
MVGMIVGAVGWFLRFDICRKQVCVGAKNFHGCLVLRFANKVMYSYKYDEYHCSLHSARALRQ